MSGDDIDITVYRAYQVVAVDEYGNDKGGLIHWGECNREGEALTGTCPRLRDQWLEIKAEDAVGRPVCKVCKGKSRSER